MGLLENSPSPDEIGGAKLTLPAPGCYHMRYREAKAYPKSVYASDEECFADIIEAYQTEPHILYDHGPRNVRINDPKSCMYVNYHSGVA